MPNKTTLVRVLALAAAIASSSAAYLPRAAGCTAEQRLAGAQGVVTAYNENTPGATAAGFNALPFGIGDTHGKCITTILADGLPGIPVGLTGDQVKGFGIATRQVFSSVTGKYTDFVANRTALIDANVTLGVRSDVVIPVIFHAFVFLDYTENCRIQAVRAYAAIPTEVLGMLVNNPGVPALLAPIIGDNPVNDLFGTPAAQK